MRKVCFKFERQKSDKVALKEHFSVHGECVDSDADVGVNDIVGGINTDTKYIDTDVGDGDNCIGIDTDVGVNDIDVYDNKFRRALFFSFFSLFLPVFVLTILLYFLLSTKILLPNSNIPVFDTTIVILIVTSIFFSLRIASILRLKKLFRKIITRNIQLRTIINNVPCITYLKDICGNILLSNEQHAKLFNLTAKDMAGKNTDDIYKNPEINRHEDEMLLKTRKQILTERKVETEAGVYSWYKIFKSPIFDDKNNLTSMVVSFKNIDDEKEAEERKNTFIATLTHDLKTPTIAQIKALDMLSKNKFGILNDNQQELVLQIKNSCSYVYNLIFTILDTYLYDRGQIKINHKRFDIEALIRETIREISNLTDEKQQEIIVDIKTNFKDIEADRFQIKRVLVNLISNAINYGSSNSVINIVVEDVKDVEDVCNVKYVDNACKAENVDIIKDIKDIDNVCKGNDFDDDKDIKDIDNIKHIENEEDENNKRLAKIDFSKIKFVSINVKNEARGFTTKNAETLFEKFATSENSKFKKTSSGLGLYLSRQIVEAHLGRIYAYADPIEEIEENMNDNISASCKIAPLAQVKDNNGRDIEEIEENKNRNENDENVTEINENMSEEDDANRLKTCIFGFAIPTEPPDPDMDYRVRWT